MIWVFAIAGVIICSFGFVLLVGAPYLPTLSTTAEQALDLLELKPGQHMLDLGSGDGAMLIRAAKRGIRATGYELNPLLFIVSWLRTRRYRHLVTVKCRNYWHVDWPNSDGIFVFLHTNFMQQLDKKLKVYAQAKPIRLVSFTFAIPGKKASRRQGALFVYEYKG